MEIDGQTGESPENRPEGGRSGRGRGVMHSWLRDLVVSVVASALIIIFLYQPVRVGEIRRGDVVVFLYPHDHEKSYIKRVIAVPGDDLKIDHGRVYVNGAPMEEPYVPKRFADDRSQPEMTVPAHEYFVMGDHRSISSDSRDFGPVNRELIYGKAAFVYWPMDQAGVVR